MRSPSIRIMAASQRQNNACLQSLPVDLCPDLGQYAAHELDRSTDLLAIPCLCLSVRLRVGHMHRQLPKRLHPPDSIGTLCH